MSAYLLCPAFLHVPWQNVQLVFSIEFNNQTNSVSVLSLTCTEWGYVQRPHLLTLCKQFHISECFEIVKNEIILTNLFSGTLKSHVAGTLDISTLESLFCFPRSASVLMIQNSLFQPKISEGMLHLWSNKL